MTAQFAHIQAGLLPVGTETDLGVIAQVSYTAYRIGDRWVPYRELHGAPAPAQPLVLLG